MKILFIFLLFIASQATVFAKPTMVWMRPVSLAISVNGYQIVQGSEYEIMKFLASFLDEFNHRYESYPVKRSWLFIKSYSTDDIVYCFYGASTTVERREWAVFSEPTSILLPYPIVAKEGVLDKYSKQGYVSLQELFSEGKTTVLFDGVVNMWSELVRKSPKKRDRILNMTPGDKDAAEITAKLIQSDRVDFGYIGSGQIEIETLETDLDIKLSVYQLQEFANQFVRGHRVMCSKNDLGKKAVEQVDDAVELLLKDNDSSNAFRDLNFDVIGYHTNLRATYNKYWQQFSDVSE